MARRAPADALVRTLAQGLYRFRARRRSHPDLLLASGGVALLVAGLVLASIAGLADTYLHRGVETGAGQPYVVQPTGSELATNVDLTQFPPDEISQVARTLYDHGFRFVRQPVSWRAIEPAKGQFAWDQYDRIVDGLNREKIGVIAVISGTPDWALDPQGGKTADGPPQDTATLNAFAKAFTARYQAKVPFVQIWNAPNNPVNWSGQRASGRDFLPLLAAGYNGAKAGYAEVGVITPELDETQTGVRGETDLTFLKQMYQAGGADFFDIVGVRLDGGTYSPDDRRVSASRINLSRAILFRELMINEGDAQTPVWATSFGWAAKDGISREEQADFAVRGLTRGWDEWPWMGLMVQWAFVPTNDPSTAPYALVNGDGTATPMFDRLTDPAIIRRSQTANAGFAPMDSSSIAYTGTWQNQHLEDRTFRTTRDVNSSATLKFNGTGAIAFLRYGPETGEIRLAIDGNALKGGAADDPENFDLSSYQTTDLPRELVTNLPAGEHTLTITLVTPGELTIGGLVVERRTIMVWPIMLLAGVSILCLFFGFRSIIYLIATRSGHLQRRGNADLWPQLPRMPDWRPSQRI